MSIKGEHLEPSSGTVVIGSGMLKGDFLGKIERGAGTRMRGRAKFELKTSSGFVLCVVSMNEKGGGRNDLETVREGFGMSQIMEEGPLREAAILTRAVENVFRKLIRLLVGRMSLVKMQEMIRIIFIEEAENRLKLENSNKKISLSRLGIVTGLDTRTLKRLREKISDRSELSDDENFLGGFTPLFRVFDLWMNDDRYYDQETKRPKRLILEGKNESFSSLVKEALPNRGITANTVLQRLERVGLIQKHASNGEIELVNKDNIFITEKELEMIEMGLDATSNLLSTILHNIAHRNEPAAKFFQRGFWNYQLSPQKIISIRKELQRFLFEKDKEGRELITSMAEREKAGDQITVGVGFYYFEKNPIN